MRFILEIRNYSFRLRFPVYVIQTEESSLPPALPSSQPEPSYKIEEKVFHTYPQKVKQLLFIFS
jgi:hypothetical protein